MNDGTGRSCAWSELEDSECWETACGHAFTFLDEQGPSEWMKFCCYCGRDLVAVPYQSPAIGEDEDDE